MYTYTFTYIQTHTQISKRNKDSEDGACKLVNNKINYNLESGIKLWYDSGAHLDANNICANLQEIKMSPRCAYICMCMYMCMCMYAFCMCVSLGTYVIWVCVCVFVYL